MSEVERKIGLVYLPNANINSWVNFLEHYGCIVRILNFGDDFHELDAIILPGVGHFEKAASYIQRKNLDKYLLDIIQSGKIVLGICLGMHLLFEGSIEGGGAGIGIFEGKVKSFSEAVDHNTNIGWSEVSLLSENVKRVYFNHSYYVEGNQNNTIAWNTFEGLRYSSITKSENVIGIQFHPEKSYADGWALLNRFIYE